MPKVDYYKIAPTWLHKGGKAELFKTQTEVDDAWEEGWGRPGSVTSIETLPGEPAPSDPAVSTLEWGTKAELRTLVAEDERYSNLKFKAGMKTETMINALVEYEVRKGIGEE
jgi:hypothetical protein